jgi:hypothetical protein
MNTDDHLFLHELVAVLRADGAVAPLFADPAGEPQIYATQAAAQIARPTLTLTGDWVPYRNGRMGQFTLEIRSRVGDERDQEHRRRVDAVLAVFLGLPGESMTAAVANRNAARNSLRAALSSRGRVEILDYGMPRGPVAGTVDSDLRTVARIRCAWRFI